MCMGGARAPCVRAMSSSAVVHSDALFVHRDTAYNNEDIPFEFDEEHHKMAETAVSRYPPQYRKAAVIPVLHVAQKQNNNWVSISAMNYVAEYLDMPPMRVYEVATFYTMFNRYVHGARVAYRSEPVGKYFVQLCTTTPCMLGGCGSTKIKDTIEDHLKIRFGQTTADKTFTTAEVECLGACANAPMMQINDQYYVRRRRAHAHRQEDLTPENTVRLLDGLARGEKMESGNQDGRLGSAPNNVERTLTSPPYGPGQYCVPEFS
ncbi:hypothetical protein MSPP1_003944 [Malassezia sp. CBS 17886]|nr:hypothetical protein MSPP1_003944 [Malassezia sp. CBS 17886]